jgi:enamine deaminase RidA (YjgF/YER057c/UK114 family)
MSPNVVTDDVIEHRLASHGLCLPDTAPTHEFVAVQIVDRVAFVSGHAPYDKGEFRYKGVVGDDLSLEEAKAAARAALLGCLASVKACLGSLERVARVLKMNG